MRMTPLYTATGSLIYEPDQFKPPELQSILQVDPTTEAVVASQVEVLRGLRMIEPVAQQLNLFDNPEFNAALRPTPWYSRLLWSVRCCSAAKAPARRQRQGRRQRHPAGWSCSRCSGRSTCVR